MARARTERIVLRNGKTRDIICYYIEDGQRDTASDAEMRAETRGRMKRIENGPEKQ